jgi:hypothetical protein
LSAFRFAGSHLKELQLAGKRPKLNSGRARHRTEEIAERLKRLMEELAQESQLSSLPPVVVGGALVIPAGLLRSLAPAPAPLFGTVG